MAGTDMVAGMALFPTAIHQSGVSAPAHPVNKQESVPARRPHATPTGVDRTDCALRVYGGQNIGTDSGPI
ncbi:hypothetical protein SXCC_01329 [Gluconacetobacter sp. SXCC-1]|nr:hypothetical protein SXCC_01329 [Gluconacetobacter sp. SXCC-1]